MALKFATLQCKEFFVYFLNCRRVMLYKIFFLRILHFDNNFMFLMSLPFTKIIISNDVDTLQRCKLIFFEYAYKFLLIICANMPFYTIILTIFRTYPIKFLPRFTYKLYSTFGQIY